MLKRLCGQFVSVPVTGPAQKTVSCTYGVIEQAQTAVIEMSGAAGITLVSDTERNPLYTTTYGVGEVIQDAVLRGCRHFIIGIGGSATNGLGTNDLGRRGNQRALAEVFSYARYFFEYIVVFVLCVLLF